MQLLRRDDGRGTVSWEECSGPLLPGLPSLEGLPALGLQTQESGC